MNKQLQAVREKVIEAVPDIMELKFGCRVVVDWYDGEIPDEKATEELICGQHIRANGGNTVFDSTLNFTGLITETLGRTITLFDCTQTLLRKGKSENIDKLVSLWKAPNSLDDQSEEAISLLFNNLVD